MHQKCIANIETLCKYREKKKHKLLLIRISFPIHQPAVPGMSDRLRPVNYLINSKQEWKYFQFTGKKKSRNREIITAAVIPSEGAVVGGTKTEDKCQAHKQIVTNQKLWGCLWEGLPGSDSASRPAPAGRKELFMEVKSSGAAAFVKFTVPIFKPRSHWLSRHFQMWKQRDFSKKGYEQPSDMLGGDKVLFHTCSH